MLFMIPKISRPRGYEEHEMATTEELLAKRAELESEIKTASQHFDSWKVIKLCREQIARIDEVLAEKKQAGRLSIMADLISELINMLAHEPSLRIFCQPTDRTESAEQPPCGAEAPFRSHPTESGSDY